MEQVNLNGEMEYSVEVRDTLAGHGIAIDTFRDFLRANGEMTLDAAIGGILTRAQNVSEGKAVAGEASGDAVLAEQEAAKAAREASEVQPEAPEAPQAQEVAPEVAQTQEEAPKAESEASPAPQATEAEAPTEQAVDAES